MAVNKEVAQNYTLLNASGEEMEVWGTAILFIVPDNCIKKRRVEALVSPDLKDADILLFWQDMKKPCWGLLPENFPDITDKEEA